MKTYLVGGAVRDKLLKREPKDLDYVIVGATPEDVQSLLDQGYTRVGADFPVFLHPETGDEYALARVERKVSAGYHGFVVEADQHVTIEEDLARRDLTINSMAMDSDGSLVDPYGGLADLHNHVLRATTAAFAEDPLRVLRLARFAARYDNFTIAPETVALCRAIGEAGELNSLSIERVWVEMEKGFNEKCILSFMEVLHETHALQHCHLLQRLFGSFLNDHQRKECKALQSVDAASRLSVCVAVLSAKFRLAAELPGMPKRVHDAYVHMHDLCYSDRGVPELHALLKKCGALREGPSFNDTIKIALVLETVNDKRLKFRARQLELGARLMRDVKASQFPDVQGKALGAAIESQRITALQMAMDIPHSIGGVSVSIASVLNTVAQQQQS